MPLVTSNFFDLYGTTLLPLLHHVVFDAYKGIPDMIPWVMRVEKSDKQVEQTTTVGGFDRAVEFSENEAVTYQDPVQGYDKSYTQVKYNKAWRVSREWIDYGKFITIKDLAKNAGKTIAEVRQIVAMDLFNNAFTTSAVNPNSESLVSTTHTMERGGTTSNRLAADADLSYTSLDSMLQLFKNSRDPGNLRLGLIPKKLLVPVEEWVNAVEITKSTLRPGTANNNLNALQGLLEVADSVYLTDADAWFVLGDVSDGQMFFFEMRAPELETDKDFDNEAVKNKLVSAFATGWSDWRNYAGTSGA